MCAVMMIKSHHHHHRLLPNDFYFETKPYVDVRRRNFFRETFFSSLIQEFNDEILNDFPVYRNLLFSTFTRTNDIKMISWIFKRVNDLKEERKRN